MQVLAGEEPHFPAALGCVPLLVLDAQLREGGSAVEALLPVHPEDLRKPAGFFLASKDAQKQENGDSREAAWHDGYIFDCIDYNW